MSVSQQRSALNRLVELYNQPGFIDNDPVSIPHQFTRKQDIEIAGFLSATIAWGQRKTIIQNAHRMIELMDHSPYDFVLHHTESDLKNAKDFKHRTFQAEDFHFFMERLQYLYQHYPSMEAVFTEGIDPNAAHLLAAIEHFRTIFLGEFITRTAKHVSSPQKGSATKRINMFLRWMVRQDDKGVDFGIWNSISPSLLSCPLDVHSGTQARKWGLLERKQNDWKAVLELDASLRELDPVDPVKYDFALFGAGVNAI